MTSNKKIKRNAMKPKKAPERLDTLWAKGKNIGLSEPKTAKALPFLYKPEKGLIAPLISTRLAEMLRTALSTTNENPKP